MEIIIQRVLTYLLCQLVAALIGYGVAFGFIVFLSLLCGVGLLAWCHWRYVVCRPRYVACGVFVGSYFGESFYCSMEV